MNIVHTDRINLINNCILFKLMFTLLNRQTHFQTTIVIRLEYVEV